MMPHLDLEVGRFAPTTSGRAHPGTLLAALLAWLDVRSRHGRFILRMEDIDPAVVSDEKGRGLLDDLVWFGLDWDELVWQSSKRKDHERALDRLQELGRLYACSCSRSVVKAAGLASASGGWIYPGTCRHRRVSDWRGCRESLRVDLSDQEIRLVDESGLNLSQIIELAMGDPVVRRPDGSVTYQLAVVTDDASSGVTRIVRGRDIAPSTATQAALLGLLEVPLPSYRHHLLLLEPQGEKLAKLHQSIGVDILRRSMTPEEMTGFLAAICGLRDRVEPCRLTDLLADFDWNRVAVDDRTVVWKDSRLQWTANLVEPGNDS